MGRGVPKKSCQWSPYVATEVINRYCDDENYKEAEGPGWELWVHFSFLFYPDV